MKLHLPKMLAAALMAASLQVSAVEITAIEEGYGESYYESSLTVNSQVMLEDDSYLDWFSPEGGTLSGNGTITCPDISELGAGATPSWSFEIGAYGESPTVFTIESGVVLRNVSLGVHGNATKLVCKNTLHNASIRGNGNIDLTHATLTGYTDYDMQSGGEVTRPVFEIGAGSGISVWREGEEYAGPYVAPVMNGNVVINSSGVLPGVGEVAYDFNQVLAGAYPILKSATFINFTKEATGYDFGTVKITGSLTINNVTPVVFSVEGEEVFEGNDMKGSYSWSCDYEIPGDAECLIVCSSVQGLGNLKPYTSKENLREEYDDSTDYYNMTGNIYFKSLDEYAFYSVTGFDGLVYIYLGKGGTGSGSPLPPDATIVMPGDSILLGKDEDSTPSVEKPVYLMGGTADATTLGAELLNNQVIMGKGGTVITDSLQTMKLSGGGQVGYSIVGVDSAAGAALNIAASGNLDLMGEKYDTARVSVQSGTVSIGANTTLGMGSGTTDVSVDSGANFTNHGKVAADVELAGGSTVLNQGTVLGDIDAQADSVVTNNGTISGTLETAGKVFGSGTFVDTNLLASAFLHVGNSPGFQQHSNLNVARGATLSFTIDGPEAATAAQHGEGTYSVLKADKLTLGGGDGKVNVVVEVTAGILAAGTEPLTLNLLQVNETNATAEDFSYTINDNNLLEEGATLTWDAAAGSMVLNAEVSKAALATLMGNSAANVANTMWASANAVQEMVRTAENQFLVGMPGQTTFWGAGIGSFMSVSGGAGFTSNAGGYAVGVQHAFTESFRAGFALGQTFGNFESDDKQLKVDQVALMPTLTAQYVTPLDKVSSLTVSGHLSYGTVESDADTNVLGMTGKSDWEDEVLNVGVRVAWNRQLTDNTTATVFTGLTYQTVEQDSFTEKMEDFERSYRDGSMSSLSLPIGVTLRGIYQMTGTNIFVPELTVAYIADIARDNPEVETGVMGISRKATGTKLGRNAITLSAGANWMFDSTWSVGAFYTLEARSKQVNQSVNASLRYCF